MNEKKVMVLIFGLVVLVAIIGLVLFYQSEKTGKFNVQLPVNIKAGKAVKRTPVKVSPDRVVVSRKIKEDPQKLTKVPETKDYDPCCLWMDKGMKFHISAAAVKYLDIDPAKIDKYEYFSKSDLEFNILPDFYYSNNIYVKGGTIETYGVGARLCVKTYKGKKLVPQAGIACIENKWWLVGGICSVGVPSEAPPLPD